MNVPQCVSALERFTEHIQEPVIRQEPVIGNMQYAYFSVRKRSDTFTFARTFASCRTCPSRRQKAKDLENAGEKVGGR